MPNLKVHLEVAKRICNDIEVTKKEKDLIMFGSILPDINPGDVIDDVKVKISHLDTHFEGREKSKEVVFLEKYHEYVKSNKVILGYYIHLFTDVFWTSNFFKIVDNTEFKDLNFDAKTKIKQNDFTIFDTYLKDTTLDIDEENIEDIFAMSKAIKEINISKEEIYESIKVSNNWPIKQDNYKVYQEDELVKLLDETITCLLPNVKKLLEE